MKEGSLPEMLLGRALVPDIADPRPEDVDAEFMFFRLGEIRRFSGNRDALTVRQHQNLCGRLARHLGHGSDVIEWAEHHDDHEYATGDIPTPLQKAIGIDRIRAIQERWDIAIREALGLRRPTDEVLRTVAFIDAVALGLEWRWALGRDVVELGLGSEIVTLTSERDLVRMVVLA